MLRRLTLASLVITFALTACSDSSTAPSATASDLATLDASSFVQARGAQIAHDVCATCHGEDLGGMTTESQTTPSLEVMLQYTFAQFDDMLNNDLTKAGTVVTSMSDLRQKLSPEDRWAVYQYLTTRGY